MGFEPARFPQGPIPKYFYRQGLPMILNRNRHSLRFSRTKSPHASIKLIARLLLIATLGLSSFVVLSSLSGAQRLNIFPRAPEIHAKVLGAFQYEEGLALDPERGLVIQLQEYEVEQTSAGGLEVSIPFHELESLLREAEAESVLQVRPERSDQENELASDSTTSQLGTSNQAPPTITPRFFRAARQIPA